LPYAIRTCLAIELPGAFMFETSQSICNKRRDERGAALLTVLMISALLVSTGGALLLVSSMAMRTAVDSTAEMQAYYAAEAGMQSALNVLRGNVAPNASFPEGTQINFRGAMTPSASNAPSDTSTTARLSGWLNYDYTPTGESAPDRVTLSSSYTPTAGLAYSVAVTDPDNTPVASGEPTRLLLRVTGYGPKGAVKKLELLIKRTTFDYVPASMLLMRGADDCTPMTFESEMDFTIGNSNAKEYSGHDRVSGAILPTFGATCDADRDREIAADGKDTAAAPKAETVSNSSLPPWLRSANDARAFLADQKASAIGQGRYFTEFSGTSGSTSSPAFTFVDGDCTLDGGAGLVIITGNLTMHGNPSFSGLVLVLGGGHVQRNGGGNGDILGAVIVAKFDVNGSGGFQAPYFDTNGGGNSLMQYDSAAVRAALNIVGPRTLGFHEF
jgi:hypothetical protein